MKCGGRRTAEFGLIIRIGNRTAALPSGFPQSALAPVAANIVLPRKRFAGHEVGTEKKAVRKAAKERADRVTAARHLAPPPLRSPHAHSPHSAPVPPHLPPA